MGTLDFFMTRNHEQLAHWARDAQAAAMQGQDALPLPTEHLTGTARIYADAMAGWQDAAYSIRRSEHAEVDRLSSIYTSANSAPVLRPLASTRSKISEATSGSAV